MFEGLFQPMHLIVIFGIALLVFGPKKLPELGKGIGEGIRGFKSAMKAKRSRRRVASQQELPPIRETSLSISTCLRRADPQRPQDPEA